MHLLNAALRLLCDLSPRFIGSEFFPVRTRDHHIDDVKLRIYIPNDVGNIGLKPVILYYHGGGWIIGSITAYDRILRYISYHTNYILVAIEYRKAPEHKFPTALVDSYVGYRWVMDNISELNGDINYLIFCGDSAGSNLILGLLKIIGEQKMIYPHLLVMIYPLLGVEVISDSTLNISRQSDWIYKISKKILNYSLSQYLRNQSDYESPYVSFMEGLGENISYPDTLIITAQRDALTSSINEYIIKLKAAGCNVSVKEYSNAMHGFLNFGKQCKAAQTALKDIVQYIKEAGKEKRALQARYLYMQYKEH